MKAQEFIRAFKPMLVKNMMGRTSVLFGSHIVPIETVDKILIDYDEARGRDIVIFLENDFTTICDLDKLVKED